MTSRPTEQPLLLACPDCRVRLRDEGTDVVCSRCSSRFPVENGVADFSRGAYYDTFPGEEALPEECLRGLRNENEGTRIEDYYLPLLRLLQQGGTATPRVLDAGCGNGQAVDLLRAAGFDAWGYDLSALRKWQWRERANRERLVVADGMKLPFDDGSFDVAIASGVLEHIGVQETGGKTYSVAPLADRDDRRRRFVAELVRVVGGGTVFLDFPNGAFPIDFWHGTQPGGARWHALSEGFLPTVAEVRALCRQIDPALSVTPRSPHRRLRFNQVGGHWYGKVFRLPMKVLYRLMSVPGFRILAGSQLNPYLVLEVSREKRGTP